MKRHWKYFKNLIVHKYWVFIYSLRMGVPLYLAIFHDLSKFYPIEWFAYVDNFYNTDGTKKVVRDKTGAYDTNKQSNNFKRAWIHHQRNKHHWQRSRRNPRSRSTGRHYSRHARLRTLARIPFLRPAVPGC